MLKAENIETRMEHSKHCYITIRYYAMVRSKKISNDQQPIQSDPISHSKLLKRKYCDEIRNYGSFSTSDRFAPGKKGRL